MRLVRGVRRTAARVVTRTAREVARVPWRSLRPRLPRGRRGQRIAVQSVMVLCVLGLVPPTWVYLSADSSLRDPGDVPRTEVAMVFGAGLRGDEPSPYLARRLDAAVGLYHAGRVEVILVTGDNSREEYDEPDTMRAYLTRQGVPDRRIVSDYAGFDSWDSCVRAREVFGVDRAVLISQGFHIRRAVALCRAAGITSYGVGVPDRRNAVWYYGATRELMASAKAASDVVLRPSPRFLGPKEPGVAAALATGR